MWPPCSMGLDAATDALTALVLFAARMTAHVYRALAQSSSPLPALLFASTALSGGAVVASGRHARPRAALVALALPLALMVHLGGSWWHSATAASSLSRGGSSSVSRGASSQRRHRRLFCVHGPLGGVEVVRETLSAAGLEETPFCRHAHVIWTAPLPSPLIADLRLVNAVSRAGADIDIDLTRARDDSGATLGANIAVNHIPYAELLHRKDHLHRLLTRIGGGTSPSGGDDVGTSGASYPYYPESFVFPDDATQVRTDQSTQSRFHRLGLSFSFSSAPRLLTAPL